MQTLKVQIEAFLLYSAYKLAILAKCQDCSKLLAEQTGLNLNWSQF